MIYACPYLHKNYITDEKAVIATTEDQNEASVLTVHTDFADEPT